MSEDRLIIEEIEAECRLGVFDWERERPQRVWVDLELTVDAAAAAAQDDVGSTVDYAKLVSAVKELAQRKPYRLLETLADQLARLVVDRFGTERVRVTVKKRSLPGIGYAAVEVERTAARRRRAGRPAEASRRRRVRAERGW